MDWMDAIRLEGLTTSRSILLGTVALIIIAACWQKILRYIQINLALYKVPGPFAYPIVGNSQLIKGGPEDFFRVLVKCHKQYGSMFRQWMGSRPIVFLCGADELQPLLSSSIHLKKSFEYKLFEPWLGEGLITSAGKKWQERRKLLTSAFHSSLLEGYIESLYREASKLTSKLEELTPQDSALSWSEAIEIGDFTKHAALDAVCETTMGFNINALEGNANLEYIHAISRLNKILQLRFISPWLAPDIIFYNTALGKEFSKHVRTVHDFTEKVIRERKDELEAEKKGNQPNQENSKERMRRKSFLDLLLILSDSGRVLSNQDIREEVDTFMFAGHDSIAGGMNWSLYALGHHPEVQERILEEAKSIMGDSEKVTLSHVNKMEYFDRCIKEAFRLFPPVPLTGRQLEFPLTLNGFSSLTRFITGCGFFEALPRGELSYLAILDGLQGPRPSIENLRDIDQINPLRKYSASVTNHGGHTFPVGTEFNILHFPLHHDPKVFPDPYKFDPDRFLPSEVQTRNPFAYMPFSAGPRNCIGQKFAVLETKLVVLRILQSLEVRSLRKMEGLRLQGEVLLNCPDGIQLSFRRRDSVKP